MCGIAGMIDFAGKAIDLTRGIQMAAVQAHRGPDGEGGVCLFADGHCVRLASLHPTDVMQRGQGAVGVLVHRRLAIIDLSERASQPMTDEHQECWITFNGEIYNYVELRAELQAHGYTFRTGSDTEVILQAYRKWGVDCLQHFNGIFAFAIWDSRHRRLFCARDHLGIKPFYYSYQHNRLLFASEPKAIVMALTPRPAPNMAAIADYLSFSFVPSTETMFAGIQRLAPGSWLIADATGLTLQSYWEPVFDPAPGRREAELVEELRALLVDAMRLQIRSDVQVGSHLSGGIDSSTVCCLAARHIPQLVTFTASFAEGGFFDETPYARLVARHITAEHHEIVPPTQQLTDLLPRILYHLDEPVEGPAVVGKYHVASLVSQSVKVVLGGQGGDELFGGYDWYIKNLFTAASFGAMQVVGQRPLGRFLFDTLTREKSHRLAKSLWKNFGETQLSHIFCRNWNRLTPSQLKKILRPEVFDGQQPPEQRFLTVYEQLQEQRAGDRMFKFDLRHYLEALLTSEDRLSMAFSVESRVPLLDYRIAEFAGRLGYEWKTEPGRSKRLLRSAVQGIVPAQILARSDKRGFPTPVSTWLHDPTLQLYDRLVFSGNDFARRYFDLNHIQHLLASRVHIGSDWSERLWRILNVSVWGHVFALA